MANIIDDVVARLQLIVNALGPADGVGCFSAICGPQRPFGTGWAPVTLLTSNSSSNST